MKWDDVSDFLGAFFDSRLIAMVLVRSLDFDTQLYKLECYHLKARYICDDAHHQG